MDSEKPSLPVQDYFPGQVPEEPEPEPMVKNRSNRTALLSGLALLAVLPVIAVAALRTQTLTGFAGSPKCRPITKVMISPGKINVSTSDPEVNLSVLAYDSTNRPVWHGVRYEWGISSSNSIGSVKSKHDLGVFRPLNPGSGDLYVKTSNNCTKTAVIGSVAVTVVKSPVVPTQPIRKIR
ncbi:hypothetical protein A2Z33_07375 [Candidatus Gottesmanbacteria bacterium RBG_16_52_11]|uniref:Uncharacterized protein n=1 Tax=Candidatus Gottesmanbacteria bacterium RBG_16_52_11 TaxID=1798374 RepID=A0A1F5YYU9_9BACT|nr:MAG: hypothetical protein A2Z33_07375 [Candidatus Gottesmanbacteria bacterium RBG_16_52_11]